MAQNYWQQECTIFYHIYPYLEVWRYDYQHDHICGPVVRNPNSEPHPNVKFSLTGAVSKSRTVPTAAQHELVLDSKKTNQLCKEPSKTETKKTQNCNEFEQTTKPFLPACGLLMIHDIPADKWIFQTCLPLSMQTTHPVPLMQCYFCMDIDIPWKEKHLLRLFQTTLKRIYQRLRNGLLCKVLLALRCPLCNCSTKTHGRPSLLTERKLTVYTMDPTLLKFEAERKNGTRFRIILFCQGSLKVFALQVKGKLKVLLHFLRPSPENNTSQWSRFQFDCCANNTIASMRKERIAGKTLHFWQLRSVLFASGIPATSMTTSFTSSPTCKAPNQSTIGIGYFQCGWCLSMISNTF